MPWNLDCDPCVSWSFLQNNNHQAVKMKWIENRKNTVKNRWDFVGIFTCDCECGSVCVCGCVCVIVAYYCVYVCEKVQTQCIVLTGYKVVGVFYFCYIISFLYV